MRGTRPRLFLPVGAIAAALMLASCGTNPSAAQQAAGEEAGDSLRVAASAIAKSVDPAAELSASYLRAHGAAEALMRITPDGKAVPELAAKMEATTPTQWTVELRKGAKFVSGAPVDAEAVVASLIRSRMLNSLAQGQLKDVEIKVAGPDKLT
jgi:peptide/nickel transport system substrate-binding protein